MNLPVDHPDTSSSSDASSYSSEVNPYATPSVSLTAIVPSSAIHPSINKHLVSTASASIYPDFHLSSWQREQRDKPSGQEI